MANWRTFSDCACSSSVKSGRGVRFHASPNARFSVRLEGSDQYSKLEELYCLVSWKKTWLATQVRRQLASSL